MNWIKNRYDQLILAVVAVALLVFAGMVGVKASGLREQFSEVTVGQPSVSSGASAIEDVFLVPTMSASTSPVWKVATRDDSGERGSFFAPGKLPGPPICVGPPLDSLTGKIVPMEWFIERNVPTENRFSFLRKDSDRDGFTNEDEWREGADPDDPESHPPYHTKLFLKQVMRTPFRLCFAAFNGDLRKPESMEFQINTVDLKQPSEFLKIGEVIPNTGLKVSRFDPKQKPGLETMDISELTLTRVDTDETFTLVITKVTDVPTRHAIFDYQWPGAAGEIAVKEGGRFGLRPQTDRNLLYQVVRVTETEAVIRLPNGQQYTVLRDPRKTDRPTPKPPSP